MLGDIEASWSPRCSPGSACGRVGSAQAVSWHHRSISKGSSSAQALVSHSCTACTCPPCQASCHGSSFQMARANTGQDIGSKTLPCLLVITLVGMDPAEGTTETFLCIPRLLSQVLPSPRLQAPFGKGFPFAACRYGGNCPHSLGALWDGLIPLDRPGSSLREHDPTCSRASPSWNQCCAGREGSSHLTPAWGSATCSTWGQLHAWGHAWGSMARSGTELRSTPLCPCSFRPPCLRSPVREHVWGLGPIFFVGEDVLQKLIWMGAHLMQRRHPKRG